MLKYALATEEAFLSYRREFTDVGYSAGAVYDLLALLMEDLVADPNARKKVAQFHDETYRKASRAAKVAAELARGMQDFAARRLLIPFCLLEGAGRIAMAMLDPGYVDFAGAVGQAGVARSLVRVVEERRFGIGSASIGAAVLQCLRIFRSMERAALAVDQPLLLKSRDKNLYQLASLGLLASNVSERFQTPKGADDPVVSQWKGPELRELKIDGRMLVEAAAKAAK